MLGLDQSSETLKIRVGDGNTSVSTFMGAFCSIILMIVTLTYAGQKIDVFLSKKDVDILSATTDSYFDVDYVFGGPQGLNIAVAILNQDSA